MKAYQDMQKQRQRLPAFQMRAKILSTIMGNQVVVVSGETGTPHNPAQHRLTLASLLLVCLHVQDVARQRSCRRLCWITWCSRVKAPE